MMCVEDARRRAVHSICVSDIECEFREGVRGGEGARFAEEESARAGGGGRGRGGSTGYVTACVNVRS